MKKRYLILVAVLLLTLPAMAEEDVAATPTRTLTGHFVWDARGSEGDLQAVFTPTGEQTWDVQFHFEFRGEPHTYSGTAEGSLGDGTLRGTVLNESKQRTFTFLGEFTDGTFTGKHAERQGESDVATGTLELKEG